MQVLPSRFEISKEYSINGHPVVAVCIKHCAGLLSGVQIVYLEGRDLRFKLTRWDDGTVNRIIKCEEK